MKAFITKYCLTDGILEVEGDMAGSMFYGKPEKWNWKAYFAAKEFFFDKADAISNAEERRIKKLQSLEKQIKKISALKFS